MFRSISESMGKPLPIGTLGLCIEAEHPWLKSFAKEDYTTPAWYSLIQTAHCENTACESPVVQCIDNTERCQRLCLLWEQEGVPHTTFRLWESPNDIAVRAFAAALVEALGGRATFEERQPMQALAEKSPRRASCPGRAEA